MFSPQLSFEAMQDCRMLRVSNHRSAAVTEMGYSLTSQQQWNLFAAGWLRSLAEQCKPCHNTRALMYVDLCVLVKWFVHECAFIAAVPS